MYTGNKNEETVENRDNDIIFSKAVRAGKRMYYIDVKQDRHDEFYLSMTESKRVKDATEFSRAVFEKHKIFLYREDMENFREALDEAISYVLSQSESDESFPGRHEEAVKDSEKNDDDVKANDDPLDLKIEF